MKNLLIISISLLCVFVCVGIGCKHPPFVPAAEGPYGNYPEAVGRIIVNKCATTGCHNAASYQNSGGLLLDTWEHLFDGGSSGAVVVPFSTEYSSLLYFINNDSTLGIRSEPRMPVNGQPLSREEYLMIRDWIAKGAPDINGNIPFGDKAGTRQKVYAIHQGCDMVAVIDHASGVVMRYIPIGTRSYPESATFVRVSPDGRYAYVSMWYDHKMYKIDTYTDRVAEIIDMGEMFWNLIHFSEDGKKLVLSNGDTYDMMQFNTTNSQTVRLTDNDFVNPHGIAANKAFDTFYVTGMFGNTVYKFAAGYNKKISIDGRPQTSVETSATPDPYDIILSPDESKYFISCAKTDELRVMERGTDALLKVIKVGRQPQLMAVSRVRPYLFVCCMEDPVAQKGYRGTVYVINYQTLEVVKKIRGDFFQPHSVTVSDKDNVFYVFSRNQDTDGPAPHHQGPCSGRNGFYAIFHLNTLEQVNGKRYEVLVDPYSCDIRFK